MIFGLHLLPSAHGPVVQPDHSHAMDINGLPLLKLSNCNCSSTSYGLVFISNDVTDCSSVCESDVQDDQDLERGP